MKRILLCYDTPGWAYHRRCLGLQAYAERHEPDFHVEISPGGNPRFFASKHHDLILQLCYGRLMDTKIHAMKTGCSALLLAGLNIGWSEEADVWLRVLRCLADSVIVNSRLVYDAAGRPDGVDWISNGVHRGHFAIQVPIERRPVRVLWTGSEFHRATKNYDTLLRPLKTRLRSHGIPCDFRLVDSHGGPTRRSASQMAEWYNTGQVYVCASRREGTPNPALEAASCGCTVVSTPVGNMPELIADGVNGALCEPTVDSLEAGVRQAVAQYEPWAESMQRTIADWDWMVRGRQYFDLFRRLLL